jgi:predicted Fe-Mo cluster-binding NifX family protein
MKVAIPTNSGKVDEHFGHCEYFTVYTANENKEIIHEELIASPNGCGCKSDIVGTLSTLGVKVMLAGNMGGGAVNKLSNHGIAVIRGCSGDAKNVMEEWLKGNIKDNGELCSEHEHHHEHNHRHDNHQ